mgnify:FL=1|tara:strand:+ start:11 stop:208 length:198 start_codon:yes stop_codon:yes gene_type:complete
MSEKVVLKYPEWKECPDALLKAIEWKEGCGKDVVWKELINWMLTKEDKKEEVEVSNKEPEPESEE